MFFFDPLYFVFAGPALLLALYAQYKVKSTYAKYAEVATYAGRPGIDVARRLLDSLGLYHVQIERVPGDLSDHYDPSSKVLRLSDSNYDNYSVAAVGVVAHEVGHAVQDAQNYAPLRWRAGLVPVVNIGSTLGYILFFVGLFIIPQLAWLGVALFSTAAIFALVTLPVEFNASNRALQLLSNNGLVTSEERGQAKAVLNAAALTYVAALAQALSTLLYFLFILMGRSDE